MNYPIPETLQEMLDLERHPVSPEIVASAIAGTIKIARDGGKTLDDLTTEVLADDRLLDANQRDWLRNILAQAWDAFTVNSEQ
ncbi:hypothetical protein [Baaleninema simplex]|uniref:hypothetical protein n=1 Tax=Baaleninema simplex TaxID=2862350 RepID=UPI000364453F|nr:hypothetical protein [Baaleninema simplex]